MGRGPTRDMSPRSTLISCGSSSTLVLRNHRPSGVIRGSRGQLEQHAVRCGGFLVRREHAGDVSTVRPVVVALVHAAQLEHGKRPHVAADPFLPEERRAGGCRPHQAPQEQQQGTRDDKQQRSERDVQCPFHRLPPKAGRGYLLLRCDVSHGKASFPARTIGKWYGLADIVSVTTRPSISGNSRDRAVRHRRIAEGHRRRWNVARDNGSSPDERPRADSHEWQNGHIDANLRSSANPGASHQLGRATVPWVEVIGYRHPGRKKYVVFEFAILREITIAVDFYAVAYAAAVIDDAVGPDRDVIADLAAFPDDDTVPSLKAQAYRRAVVEYGSRPEPGPGPKDQRRGASARHGVADEDARSAASASRPVRTLGAHWTSAVSGLTARPQGFGKRLAHVVDLTVGHVREHRQRQNFARRLLGNRQRALRETPQRGLPVARHGVMHAGLDAALGQFGADPVSPGTRTTNR